MEEFKLYSVSDEYIEYLRAIFPNVYSNKETTRVHIRKYVGIVLRLGNYHYYIPMSSPKESEIRKNQDKILANAKLLYKQKTENDLWAGYVKAALEYKALEKLCGDFMSEKK